jgi:hypothetical protein
VRERGADVGDARDVDQELGQLVDVGRDLGDPLGKRRACIGPCGELADERVVMADHRGAGARRRDHRVVPGERPGEPVDQRDRGVLVAGVEVHLAAARLIGRELDVVAEAAQQPHDGSPDLGEQRVVVAGDEERDAHQVAALADGRSITVSAYRGEHASRKDSS